MYRFKNAKLGFTLVEILIVVTIIGLLSSVALFAYDNAKKKARDAQRLLDLGNLEKALEYYASVNGKYPERAYNGEGLWGLEKLIGVLSPEYIPVIPVDPLIGDHYDENSPIVDDNDRVYQYSTLGSSGDQGYILTAKLESYSDYPFCYIVAGDVLPPGIEEDTTWPVGDFGAANIIGKDCHDLMR